MLRFACSYSGKLVYTRRQTPGPRTPGSVGVLIQPALHVLLVKRLEVLAEHRELPTKIIGIRPSRARHDALQRSNVLP